MSGKQGLAAVAAILIGMASAGTADANVVRVGDDLSQPSEFGSPCSAQGCVATQVAFGGAAVTGGLTARSPVNGVVTSWSIRVPGDDATYLLRTAKVSATGDTIAVNPGSASGTITPGPEAIHTFPASLQISAGDAIALQLGPGAERMPGHSAGAVEGDVVASRSTPFTDGVPAPFEVTFDAYRLSLRADISYCAVGSVTGLRTADAAASLSGAACGVRITKRPLKKKKRRGTVLSQSAPAGTTAPPGTEVALVVGSKPKPKRKPKKKR